MAATFPAHGRAIQVKRGSSPALITGVRTKSISISGSSIDVTNDDDAGIRKLMDMPGEVAVSISISGITKEATLRDEALLATDRVLPTEFTLPGATPGKFAGDFFLASYTETGEYQGAGTFEATFESAGTVTYTAPI